jgi:hypothetical protein
MEVKSLTKLDLLQPVFLFRIRTFAFLSLVIYSLGFMRLALVSCRQWRIAPNRKLLPDFSVRKIKVETICHVQLAPP